MSVRKELPALTSGWEHLPEGASIEKLARFAVDVATLEAEGADGTMAAVRFWVPATEQGDPVPFVIWRAAAENFLRRAAEESGLGVEKALEVFTEGALQVQASFSKAAARGAAEPIEALQLRENIGTLLHQIGEKGNCRGCGREIWWVRHKNGKKAPYTSEGLNHFADCPVGDRFKKGK